MKNMQCVALCASDATASRGRQILPDRDEDERNSNDVAYGRGASDREAGLRQRVDGPRGVEAHGGEEEAEGLVRGSSGETCTAAVMTH